MHDDGAPERGARARCRRRRGRCPSASSAGPRAASAAPARGRRTTGQQRRAGREREHRAVDADAVRARHARFEDRRQQIDAPHRDKQSEDPAGSGQRQAFGHELAQQAGRARRRAPRGSPFRARARSSARASGSRRSRTRSAAAAPTVPSRIVQRRLRVADEPIVERLNRERDALVRRRELRAPAVVLNGLRVSAAPGRASPRASGVPPPEDAERTVRRPAPALGARCCRAGPTTGTQRVGKAEPRRAPRR